MAAMCVSMCTCEYVYVCIYPLYVGVYVYVCVCVCVRVCVCVDYFYSLKNWLLKPQHTIFTLKAELGLVEKTEIFKNKKYHILQY
jgi:hypothetical protein